MSSHHPLRSHVVHRRFAAVVAAANALLLVVVGLLPLDTVAASITPYAMALNAGLGLVGLGVTLARRNVHHHRARGLFVDLAFGLIIPALGLLVSLVMISQVIRPDVS